MNLFASMQFPGGFMLTIKRPGAFDAHGDATYTDLAPQGPCFIPRKPRARVGMSSGLDGRVQERIHVRAPVGMDVRREDRVTMPNGLTLKVLSDPELARNPFTSWEAYLTFQLTEVG